MTATELFMRDQTEKKAGFRCRICQARLEDKPATLIAHARRHLRKKEAHIVTTYFIGLEPKPEDAQTS